MKESWIRINIYKREQYTWYKTDALCTQMFQWVFYWPGPPTQCCQCGRCRMMFVVSPSRSPSSRRSSPNLRASGTRSFTSAETPSSDKRSLTCWKRSTDQFRILTPATQTRLILQNRRPVLELGKCKRLMKLRFNKSALFFPSSIIPSLKPLALWFHIIPTQGREMSLLILLTGRADFIVAFCSSAWLMFDICKLLDYRFLNVLYFYYFGHRKYALAFVFTFIKIFIFSFGMLVEGII